MTHGLEAASHLADDVGQPLPVLLSPLQPSESLAPTGAKLRDARRLLKHRPPVAARGHQERVDAALLDDAVGLGGGSSAGEEFTDVAKPGRFAVDEVFALTIAVYPPGDSYLLALRGELPRSVVEDERHLGHVERLPRCRTGEDDVGHLLAAEATDRLLAEHPFDRINDVRLARAVGPHHDGDAGGELEARAIGEALEAEEF